MRTLKFFIEALLTYCFKRTQMELLVIRLFAISFVFIRMSYSQCLDQKTSTLQDIGANQICCNGTLLPKSPDLECRNNTLIPVASKNESLTAATGTDGKRATKDGKGKSKLCVLFQHHSGFRKNELKDQIAMLLRIRIQGLQKTQRKEISI